MWRSRICALATKGEFMTVPETMLAARLLRHGGPEALELARVRVPTPGTGEVLVRVGAAALNNTDVWTREGSYGLPGEPMARAGWLGAIDFPRIQGADIAGTVALTGEGVDSGLLGARVLVDPALYDGPGEHAEPVGLLGSERDGGYAEYTVVAADRVHLVQDSPLGDVELACLPTSYGTALGMLERGGVQAGETVVVTGASGGLGLALVQLAVARGAHVIAISSSSKLASVREAGAGTVLDRGTTGVWEQVPEGVDAVLDVVGGHGITEGMDRLRLGGRWVIGGALGGNEARVDVRRIYTRRLRLIGSSMHTPAHFHRLVDLARQGAVSPVVASTYPLAEVHRAQAALDERRHVGKLVLTLSP